MGLFDKVNVSKITNFFGLSDDEYDDYEEEITQQQVNGLPIRRGVNQKPKTTLNNNIPRPRVQAQMQQQAQTQQQPQTRQTQQPSIQPQRMQPTGRPAYMQQQQSQQSQQPRTIRPGTPQPSVSVHQNQNQFTRPPRVEQQRVQPNGGNVEKVVNLDSRKSQSPSNQTRQTRVTVTPKPSVAASQKIAIKEPRVYAEAMDIGKLLIAHEAVLINFHLMGERSASRCVDFFTGIVFAIDGDIQRVGNEIFLCTPPSIQVDSNAARSLFGDENFEL